MRIINAIATATTSPMSKNEIEKFLEGKLNLQLGTIDGKGDPNIQPVWFNYDKKSEKIFIVTPRMSKKVQNLRHKSNIYFSIDDENFPYKGIKGKGTANIVEDLNKSISEAKLINVKYLGTLDHPMAKMILESASKGNHVLIEINPQFFSTWDFSKNA
jgi:nitroimidazol reductase NimA-like FMN-containing flavoprotein (pyridoxamine 5'-phosphate oxidase superfamily)